MPDNRRHRGAHPQDAGLFGPRQHEKLRAAVEDMSWLMGREYASKAALALVGDRYQLHERQRSCVLRAAASDAAVEIRGRASVTREQLAGRTLWLDGYNVLITVEAALAGGTILYGRDGCLRDIAAMHGTFRRVEETEPALQLCGQALQDLGVNEAVWYLDAPVSNSGRLKTLIQDTGRAHRWNCRAEVVLNPDAVLKEASEIIATADGIILDSAVPWFNFARFVVENYASRADVLNFQDGLSNSSKNVHNHAPHEPPDDVPS